MVTRAFALDSGLGSANKDGDEAYEGGMVVAPRLSLGNGAAELHEGRPTFAYEQLEQSLHVAPTKDGSDGIHCEPFVPGGPTGPPIQDIEKTVPETSGTLKKETALSFLAGRTLGACGHELHLKILEVLPLRSQSMGRRDSKSLFPLPTSRNLLRELLPTLCEWFELDGRFVFVFEFLLGWTSCMGPESLEGSGALSAASVCASGEVVLFGHCD